MKWTFSCVSQVLKHFRKSIKHLPSLICAENIQQNN
nr:MAG TPA: hypothetical protein [Caudoviricetes sp.]